MDKKIISFFTRWKVILPLAAIVLVWFFWPQPKQVIKKQISANSSLSAVPQSSKEVSIASLFGVNKKVKCSITSATAYIDDSKITATLIENKKRSRIIFDGHCLYRWNEGSSGGDRSCGLKSYLPFVSQLASNDSLKKLYPQVGELSTACKEVSTIDQKLFEVPKKVLFKNKKLF